YSLREEVSLPQRLGVHRQELIPGLLTALRARLEAVLAHDVDDELPREFSASQLLHLTHDAAIAPARLAGDHDHQVPKGHQRRPADFRRIALTSLVQQPTAESPRRNDCDQLADGGTDRLAEPNQPAALSGRDLDPLGQPIAEDLVLGLEVADLAGQFPVRRV